MIALPLRSRVLIALLIAAAATLHHQLCLADDEPTFPQTLSVDPPHFSTDKSVKIDYDIVYVRARRAGDKIHKRFYTDFSQPVTMEPGADLMLLHPDGKEELLVEGGDGSITDPVMSFDGQWCYFVHIYNLVKASQWSPPKEGADIFKIHLKSRKVVRLTNQVYTPNTGAGDWTATYRQDPKNPHGKNFFESGVFNMGPCPLPGGRIVFTSNREGFRPSQGYPAIALQLFVMDDRDTDVDAGDPLPSNIEKIGHFNIAGALHPVVLRDGRIMFSTLESQGIRSDISWGIWLINPDGTQWNPLVSAFDPGGAANGFHFQTQLSDGSIIIEQYYNQNNSGFGAYIKLPSPEKAPYPAFGPGYMGDPRNPALRFGRHYNGKGKWYRMPFMPRGAESFTPFADNGEGPADPSILTDKESPKVGKVTHPSAAPDNHLLTIWSPGPTNHQYTFLPQLDGGIYLIKSGKTLEQPGDMLLIKNDPNYNESWPRAVVPYQRIYGIKEPKKLPHIANDGKLSKQLPEGTPFGLVGTSSFYKRESYPNGVVPEGSVTATYVGKGNQHHRGGNGGEDPWKALDPFTSHGYGMPINWHNQGADAGLYENSDIHAVRILAMEPTTDRKGSVNSGRQFYSHATERLRILGEIPLRKFDKDGKQPTDPDGNPDTSFLAKVPADTAFTFQTIDKRGLVLNMAQTWHQVRPGEMRADCGGCHAHSQEPTDFNKTIAARDDYAVWDLVNHTPLVTTKTTDESKKKWDAEDDAGLRDIKHAVLDVEYNRDIKPILQRSCVACHTKDASKGWDKPAGNLVLDADDEEVQYDQHGKFPGTYYRLALDERAKFGYKPATYDSWGYPNASRYIRKMQSRRSMLVWKIFGQRLDGFSNDDHPSEPTPGAGYHEYKGERYDKRREWYDLDYVGKQMPPPEAVAGKFKAPDGRMLKVEPLTDEDRRTIARWIDLGCPIDRAQRDDNASVAKAGWFLDDNRPVLTMPLPGPGRNDRIDRIIVGMYDYNTGLVDDSFTVTADFAIDGVEPGKNLAAKFKPTAQGVRVLELAKPIDVLDGGTVRVSVRDKQGNVSTIVRRLSVGPAGDGRAASK